jgi:hypothetical protein
MLILLLMRCNRPLNHPNHLGGRFEARLNRVRLKRSLPFFVASKRIGA